MRRWLRLVFLFISLKFSFSSFDICNSILHQGLGKFLFTHIISIGDSNVQVIILKVFSVIVSAECMSFGYEACFHTSLKVKKCQSALFILKLVNVGWSWSFWSGYLLLLHRGRYQEGYLKHFLTEWVAGMEIQL